MGIDSGTGRGHITMTRGLISNGGIVKTGRGTLNLNVEQPYTGPTLVNMGSVTIIGSGSIRNSSAVHVRPTSSAAGADVNSHELVAGLNDRLGDSAPIVLSSEVGGSTRALFAGDFGGFEGWIAPWPEDIRDHADRQLHRHHSPLVRSVRRAAPATARRPHLT